MVENEKQFKKINEAARKKTRERGKKEQEELDHCSTQQELF